MTARRARLRLVPQGAVRTEHLDPAGDALGKSHAPTGAVQHPQGAADPAVGEPPVVARV